MGSLDPASMTGERLPLAASQREVWIDQKAWPGSAHLNIGGCAFIHGPLDLGLMQRALEVLVEETEALRLVPDLEGHQVLLPSFSPTLLISDLSGSSNPGQAIRDAWRRQMAEPFPLGEVPPWRFTVEIGSPEFHGSSIQFHHLVMDGWGTTTVVRRWTEIYDALAQGRAPEPSPAAGYAAHVADSVAYLGSAAYARDAAFWSTRMAGLPERLFEPRSRVAELRGLSPAYLATYPIPRADYDRLTAAASGLGVTSFVLFFAAIAVYFSRTRGRRELVVGVPSLNRGKRFRDTPGMFAGVVPIRVAVLPGDSVAKLIAEINQALRESLRHASFPLSEIGRNIQLIRQGRESVFDILLSFERQNYDVSFGDTVHTESRQLFSGISRYPLGVTVCEFSDLQDIELALEGSSAYFVDGDMPLLGHRLWHLVREIAAHPEASIGGIDVLPDEERWAVVEGLHRDVAHHESPQTFISQFEHQVALRPEATALTWDFGSMDYQTLDGRANALAARIAASGGRPGAIVAIAVPRSPELMVALLAVAKTGAAFLPIDVDAPLERLRDILRQSVAAAILLPDELVDRFSALGPPCIVVDAKLRADPKPIAIANTPGPSDAAYVLFTSGSTGTPKGVVVEHATLSRRLAWLGKAWAVDWHDRSAQATQITFDPALIETLLPLIHGGSIALPPPGRLRPESLATFAIAHGVTMMAFVPSTLAAFLDGIGGRQGLRLRVACCGGEILHPELADRFLAETGARLFNVYGPTEAAIFATAHACQGPASEGPLPIGRPIDDTRVYVLDEAMRPLPFGEQGEIYIGGDTIARGYLNRAELTDGAFLADPFRPGGRMYRTGDRGWIGNDGNVFFTGRLDRQIKLRGYRIELGEIEAALAAVPGVELVAAKLVSEPGSQGQIHAWVAAPANVERDLLHRQLRSRLPDYMHPSRIAILPALPLTPAGKVDLARLPAADEAGDSSAVSRRLPATTLERDLLALWADTLKKPGLGVRDNFFEAGGDSLAAIGILAGIEQLTGSKVSLYALTEHPTVERLAEALSEELTTARLVVRLSRQRATGRTLYIAASGHGDLLRFQNLARALGDDFEVHLLQPASGSTATMIRELAAQYAERIALRHPEEVCLAGFSVGGLTALETARALAERGIRVPQLILIDTVYPSRIIGRRRFWDVLGWLTRNLHLQDLSMNGRRLEAMFNDPGLRLQVAALDAYAPAPYAGDTLLIKSTGLASWERWLFRPWRRVMADRLHETTIQGLHGSIFESSSVERLSALIRSDLAGDVALEAK
jgi:syringomycin synthetase protein SyrE